MGQRKHNVALIHTCAINIVTCTRLLLNQSLKFQATEGAAAEVLLSSVIPVSSNGFHCLRQWSFRHKPCKVKSEQTTPKIIR